MSHAACIFSLDPGSTAVILPLVDRFMILSKQTNTHTSHRLALQPSIHLVTDVASSVSYDGVLSFSCSLGKRLLRRSEDASCHCNEIGILVCKTDPGVISKLLISRNCTSSCKQCWQSDAYSSLRRAGNNTLSEEPTRLRQVRGTGLSVK